MIRLGLCCLFRDQPIRFVQTTATAAGRLTRADALEKISRLCLANADALLAALQFCAASGIGCFRINSQILPLKTHPTAGYAVDELPAADEIVARFKQCGAFARRQASADLFSSRSVRGFEFAAARSGRGIAARARISGRGRRVGCGRRHQHPRRRRVRRQAQGAGRFCPDARPAFRPGPQPADGRKRRQAVHAQPTCCRFARPPACRWFTTCIIIAAIAMG